MAKLTIFGRMQACLQHHRPGSTVQLFDRMTSINGKEKDPFSALHPLLHVQKQLQIRDGKPSEAPVGVLERTACRVQERGEKV